MGPNGICARHFASMVGQPEILRVGPSGVVGAAGRRGIVRDAALTTTLGVAIFKVSRCLAQATGAGFLPAHGPGYESRAVEQDDREHQFGTEVLL